MLLINLIFEFCVIIVQAGCTPRAWLPSDLATSPLVCNLYIYRKFQFTSTESGFTCCARSANYFLSQAQRWFWGFDHCAVREHHCAF